MLRNAFERYISNFSGFSREIWILTIITFINRAGTMVLPFLSKYLKENQHFSYGQVGWIMVGFGLGSMLGSFLGGKLSDKMGFYKIMIFSLFTSGLLFFAIQYITSFWGLCIGMFVIMTIADMFRPAMFVSLGTYAKPENRARAFTLVRLAINLGFAAGPALGGLIIMNIGYGGLFWVDGATCILAITVFALLVKERKITAEERKATAILYVPSSFARKKIFFIFLFVSFATAMLFFQIFSTLPLYQHEMYGWTEFQTGLLMTMNGFLIFLLEMPIVSYFERKKVNKIKLIFWGSLMMASSFYVLLFNGWSGVLIIGMLLITFAEMFIFPFSNSFALGRASKGREGTYMAMFTMSFSLAQIGSSKVGMDIIEYYKQYGYHNNWVFMGSLGMTAVLATIYLQKLLREEIS
ncbi:MAG: MFS transporter [Flavobacterium sp.]|nr:MFS transporter [Flavobacterium sp.]